MRNNHGGFLIIFGPILSWFWGGVFGDGFLLKII
jgi:hypothetical protein